MRQSLRPKPFSASIPERAGCLATLWGGGLLLFALPLVPAPCCAQQNPTPSGSGRNPQSVHESAAAKPEPGKKTAAAPRKALDIHFQSTLIGQGVLPFPAEYSGPNSLDSHGQVRETFSFDGIANLHLWHGGGFFADVLAWQGFGLSNTEGVAGFPNGEAYRVGKSYPDAVVARAYLQESVPLGRRDSNADVKDTEKRERRLTLTIGRFAATDVFDKNAYANDPRTQFLNWAFVNNLAWDYPANTVGVTNGASAVIDLGAWTARAGLFQVSRVANGIRLDWNLARAWSWAGEIDKRQRFRGHPGVVRLLAYEESAHMGSFQESLRDPANISAIGQSGYRKKYGFGINLQQEIGKDLGAFARLGWNDGKNQVWEFTDADRTASAGIRLMGKAWHRPADSIGLATVVNGISAVHRQFLANGGLGITVGDGKLDYGTEKILEAYYSFASPWRVSVSPDFQFVSNPSYNRARGPASIFAVRIHWEN